MVELALQVPPVKNGCAIVNVPLKVAPSGNLNVPIAPPTDVHDPVNVVPSSVTVALTTSVTVAPPLTYCQEPFHFVPPVFGGLGAVVLLLPQAVLRTSASPTSARGIDRRII